LGYGWRGTAVLGAFALRCLLVLKERGRRWNKVVLKRVFIYQGGGEGEGFWVERKLGARGYGVYK
jgi:hypothetical protein